MYCFSNKILHSFALRKKRGCFKGFKGKLVIKNQRFAMKMNKLSRGTG